MNMFSKGLIAIFSAGLLVLWVLLQYIGVMDIRINYLFNLLVGVLYLVVGATTLYGYIDTKIDKQKVAMRSFLSFYGAALISWAAAAFIWSYYNFFLHTEVPYPSFADAFYLLFSFLLGWSFWHYFDIFHAEITKESLRDSILIIVGVYFLIFFVLYQPKYELDTPLLETVLNYLYPLLDATILSLAFVTLRLEKKEEITNTIYVVLAILSQVIGDILFSFRNSNRTYWNGDISDLFFLLTAIFSFIGILKVKDGFLKLHKNNKT